MAWASVKERYDPSSDSIELVNDDGDVVGRLHRNAIIRMVGLLPAEPPEKLVTKNPVGRRVWSHIP